MFDTLQLEFRQVHNPDQQRKAICDAADRMGFAWIALKTVHEDGRVEEELWRPPDGKPDLSRIVTMTIPFKNGHGGPGVSQQQLEIAICVNGSLEAVGRRATLFGRLIDESVPLPS